MLNADSPVDVDVDSILETQWQTDGVVMEILRHLKVITAEKMDLMHDHIIKLFGWVIPILCLLSSDQIFKHANVFVHSWCMLASVICLAWHCYWPCVVLYHLMMRCDLTCWLSCEWWCHQVCCCGGHPIGSWYSTRKKCACDFKCFHWSYTNVHLSVAGSSVWPLLHFTPLLFIKLL